MDRGEALKLLRGGEDGVAEWNRWRVEGEEIPSLSGADLSGANLRGAELRGADLRGAKLSGAYLSGAYLIGATLSDAILSGANLNRAKLFGANLRDANLSGANLRYADLRIADLIGAILSSANLSDAHLGANLSGANLRNANLRGADFYRAVLSGTVFANVDLSKVNSLENVMHLGPSSVGIDTLQRSAGKIPDKFLRGCGLSPWQTDIAKLCNADLSANQVSELISADLFSKRTVGTLYLGGVFISYSHSEKGIADKLYKKLYDAGASVWLDRHDAVAGDLNKQIQHEIRLRDIVVLILSESSVDSDWVEHELKSTRAKEKKENRDVLCPISMDDSWKSMLSNPNWGHLSDKLILDFSAWKTKAFDKQFDKLLKGMKINYEVRK